MENEPLNYTGAIKIQYTQRSKLTAIVIRVNNPVRLHGDLECTAPFRVIQSNEMRPKNALAGLIIVITSSMIAPNKLRLDRDFPLWRPDTPLFFVVESQQGIGDCEFHLR